MKSKPAAAPHGDALSAVEAKLAGYSKPAHQKVVATLAAVRDTVAERTRAAAAAASDASVEAAAPTPTPTAYFAVLVTLLAESDRQLPENKAPALFLLAQVLPK